MKRKGLFSKMMLTYTIIIGISFGVIATVLSFWFQGYYFEQRTKQLLSEVPFIEDASLNYRNGNASLDSLNERIKYISKFLNVDIFLVDSNGIVYAASNSKYKNLEGRQILTNELIKLRNNEMIDNKDGYSKLFNNRVHTFIKPMNYNDVFVGATLMNTSLKEIQDPIKKVYMIIWFSALFAVVGSSFVIYYFSQKIIVKPLAEINNAARKISKGEVDKRVDIHSDDEIGELANSFDTMADSLQQVENNRRIFISNVSHELRSPITSIKGFVSGILDGVIPKEKENYYLSIVYEEIQRLTRLVNDLLDLSAMEAGELKLKIREVDINEIIRLAVIKFEPQIRLKRINIDVCFDNEEIYIMADRDRLMQVVTNLFDNAIKYVNDGGNIKVCSKEKGQKVFVTIFNDGPNIPKEDEEHIFERFYKVDKSRTSKVSTGLGLSIVRNILIQMGEDIHIDNRIGEGVGFIFTLKKAL